VAIPQTGEPDSHAAFRPIMPGEFNQQPPAQPVPIPEPPPIENEATVQSTILQSTIDELNRKIADLESQLSDARHVPPGIPNDPPSESLPIEKEEPRKFKSLPIINRQEVTVYRDESQDVRIEIADKVLFKPNAWELTAEGEETFRAIAAEIRAADGKAFLDIEGHTDSLMNDPNNPTQKHDISSVKTKVIMDYFVNLLRWDVTRIRTSSFGRNRPIAGNGTPEGRERNNRIEIVVREE
jgi:chemotaxis protein MotB